MFQSALTRHLSRKLAIATAVNSRACKPFTVLDTLSRTAAEDVAQEVFVKLWQALPRYDGRAQLSTWIYAITRNAAISAMRKRRRTLSMSDPAVQDEVESRGVVPVAEPEDAALWRSVEALPDKQRQAITLYYQEQRQVEEVAAMMGLPVNTVKTHLHRARASLAAALRSAGLEGV